MGAAVAALLWASSPWRDGYATLGDTVVGPAALHLDLSFGTRLERKLRPFSAGFGVPVFALFAAGVSVVGGGFGPALRDPAAVGLVVGKAIGVLGGTWAVAQFTRAELDEDLAWTDVFGLSLPPAGVGFTVSLLVGELAFATGLSATTTSSSRCSAEASSPLSSPPSSCACATGTTASSRRGRPPTWTTTACRTSTRASADDRP